MTEAPRGSLVVYATAPGSVAADGGGRNGIFTGALLRSIRTTGVEVESMLKSVRQDVMVATGNAQVPWSSSSLSGGFYFAGRGTGGGEPAAQPAAVASLPTTAETAELYVVTDPAGADVALDGERKGASPILIKDLPVGRKVRVEARSGNRTASSELTLDKAELRDLSLTLQAEKGHLIVASTEPAVRVVLDGRALGEIGTGLFRDVEAGSHSVELTGTGVYWKGDVTIAAGKTAELKAEPYAVGEIVHDIPYGAEATVAGMGTSQTLRSSGRAANLKVGRYDVVVSGSGYDTVRLTVDLSRGQSYELKPYRTGTLLVESTPSGAEVTVGGVYRGTTPVTLTDVPAGSATVELALSGYTPERRDAWVTGGKRSNVAATLVKATLVEMVLVEGGTFQMGSTSGDSDEKPVHSVTVSSFCLGKYEVTQKQWVAVMGSNPSNFKGDNLPVEQVSWLDAVDFCNRLSAKEGLEPCYTISGTNVTANWSASGYRLPTEAEWEYAARGGRSSRGYTYAGGSDAGAVGWYSGNSGSTTHPVGGKQANELGLYDMSGNVWEWCWDWYGSYGSGAQADPRGPSSGQYRLLRGGSWNYDDTGLRASYRIRYVPGLRLDFNGFRLARPRA